ncbi:hypothetical protein HGQ17_13225 [Nesterenkonia sp. MY13]|uniref:Leucine rich repeat variant domain-containing protein n=1 Tax=Nesterenkonia sedimenti TaxID=1463632 RepID=A0A7X8TM52_9MICC|nr:hypothetical protein [Nesterenkonia sedimenti]NLS10937.1 hypothetical protein [Nesterenkonia sedimenti]
MTDHRDLEAMASNPLTDWDVLHWIAENHPEVRPAVAGNPGTYQELVDALGALGDPEIDAAIAARPSSVEIPADTPPASQQPPAPEPAEPDHPISGMWDTHSTEIPAYRDEPAEYYTEIDYSGAGYSDYPEQDYQQDYADPEDTGAEYTETDPAGPVPTAAVPTEPPAPEQPASTQEQTGDQQDPPTGNTPLERLRAAAPAAPGAAPQTTGAQNPGTQESTTPSTPPQGTPAHEVPVEQAPLQETPAHPGYAQAGYAQTSAQPPPEPEDEPQKRRLPVLPIAAAIFGVVGVGALITLLIVLLGGEDEEPTAEPSPEAPAEEPEAPAEEQEEANGEDGTEEGTEEEVDDEAAIEEARTAVAGLPEDSSCEVQEDAGVVAQFITAGTQEEGWPGDEDAGLLEETFADLQSECSSNHAAGVFESARSGEQAPEDGQGEALTAVGTGWVDRYMGIEDAEETGAFQMHDGNIQCEFADGVTCTVYDHDFGSPDDCEDGVTYRMQADGEAEMDCAAYLEPDDERISLGDEQRATDGFLVCMNISNRVSCYNSIDGNFFELSETGHHYGSY